MVAAVALLLVVKIRPLLVKVGNPEPIRENLKAESDERPTPLEMLTPFPEMFTVAPSRLSPGPPEPLKLTCPLLVISSDPPAVLMLAVPAVGNTICRSAEEAPVLFITIGEAPVAVITGLLVVARKTT